MTNNLTIKQELERCERWLEDKTIEYEKIKKELEELKRYPTSEEVCGALSKYYGDIVSYSNERHNHMFYFEESKLGILRLLNNGVYFIQSDYHKTNALPPHLITLIGRFYANEVKGE